MTIVSAAQVRAARAILDWGQEDLSRASGLSLNTIRKIENGHISPRTSTSSALRRSIEDVGLELLDDDGVKRRDDLVNVYKGMDGYRKFWHQLLMDLRESAHTVALALHSPETLSWFFSDQNIYALDVLNRPTIAASVKCLISDNEVSPFLRPSFELRLTQRQNAIPLPWLICGNRYSIIAHVDMGSPPYFVSFRIPQASRAFMVEYQQAWKVGQRIMFPEIQKRPRGVQS